MVRPQHYAWPSYSTVYGRATALFMADCSTAYDLDCRRTSDRSTIHSLLQQLLMIKPRPGLRAALCASMSRAILGHFGLLARAHDSPWQQLASPVIHNPLDKPSSPIPKQQAQPRLVPKPPWLAANTAKGAVGHGAWFPHECRCMLHPTGTDRHWPILL